MRTSSGSHVAERRSGAIGALAGILLVLVLLASRSPLRADPSGPGGLLATVQNLLNSVQYDITVDHFGTAPPTRTTRSANIQLTDTPTTLSVNGSGGWEMAFNVRALDVLGSKKAQVTIKAFKGVSTAPASLPVKVSLFFDLPGQQTAVTFGYDTSSATAPAEYKGLLEFERRQFRTDVELTSGFTPAAQDEFKLFARFEKLISGTLRDPTEVSLTTPRQQDGLVIHADIPAADEYTNEDYLADLTVPAGAAPLPATVDLTFKKTTVTPQREQTITVAADALQPGKHVVTYDKDDATDANEVPPIRQELTYTGPSPSSSIGSLVADFTETKGGVIQSTAHGEALGVPSNVTVEILRPGRNGKALTVDYAAASAITELTATVDNYRADGTVESTTTATASGLPASATVDATLSGAGACGCGFEIATDDSGPIESLRVAHTRFLANGSDVDSTLTFEAEDVADDLDLAGRVERSTPTVVEIDASDRTPVTGAPLMSKLQVVADSFRDNGTQDSHLDVTATGVPNDVFLHADISKQESVATLVNLTTDMSAVLPQLDLILDTHRLNGRKDSTAEAHITGVPEDIAPLKITLEEPDTGRERTIVDLTANRAIPRVIGAVTSWGGGVAPITRQLSFDVAAVPARVVVRRDSADPSRGGNSVLEVSRDGAGEPLADPIGLVKIGIGLKSPAPSLADRTINGNLMEFEVESIDQSPFSANPDTVRVRIPKLRYARLEQPSTDDRVIAQLSTDPVAGSDLHVRQVQPDRNAEVFVKAVPSSLSLTAGPGGDLAYTASSGIAAARIRLDDSTGLSSNSDPFEHASILLQGLPSQLSLDSNPGGADGIALEAGAADIPQVIGLIDAQFSANVLPSTGLLDAERVPVGMQGVRIDAVEPTVRGHVRFTRLQKISLQTTNVALGGGATDQHTSVVMRRIPANPLSPRPDLYVYSEKPSEDNDSIPEITTATVAKAPLRLQLDVHQKTFPATPRPRTVTEITYDAQTLSGLIAQPSLQLWSNAGPGEFMQLSARPLPDHIELCQDSAAGSCTAGIGAARPPANGSLRFRASTATTIDFLNCVSDLDFPLPPEPTNSRGNCEDVLPPEIVVQAKLTLQYVALEMDVPTIKDDQDGFIFVDTDLTRVDGPVPNNPRIWDPANTTRGLVRITGPKGDGRECSNGDIGMKEMIVDNVKANDRFVPFGVPNIACQPLSFNMKPGDTGSMSCGWNARFDMNGNELSGNIAEELCMGLRQNDTGA